MARVFLILLLAAVAAWAAGERLYLKDGSYQLAKEYQVQGDRVRYLSAERGEWEEIPLELVDLERTRRETAENKAQLEADDKAEAAERAAERAARLQVKKLPTGTGAFYIRTEDASEPVKQAEVKLVNNKTRSILKALSPVPLVPGKSTLELEGEHAPLVVAMNRPEFFFRLNKEEPFAIVKLYPKKGARVVMNLSTLTVQGERMVDEEFQKLLTFKKQEGDQLFRMWPEKPLEPGEYALIQYTEGKANPQVWDFSVAK